MELTFEVGSRECFANHVGFWSVEPVWFEGAVASIRAGVTCGINPKGIPARADVEAAGKDSSGQPRYYEVTAGGIAVANLVGPMMKGVSKFGGTSTVLARKDIRQAARDADVDAILLRIDSPGGHVAGTSALAADVVSANAAKPVYAHIEDLGASAAYWVASGARRVTADETAEVGSIGTVAVVEDSSEMAEKAGVKVFVISTGEYKGSFVPGTEVEDSHLEYVKERVADLNGFFLSAVSAGRNLSGKALDAVTDGRVHIAGKALELGLIDTVSSLDETIERIHDVIEADYQRRKANSGLAQARFK